MRRSAWKDISKKTTEQLYKVATPRLETIILKTKEKDLLENYLLFVHKLF